MKLTICLILAALHLELSTSENSTTPLYIGALVVESGQHTMWAGGVGLAIELAVQHINNHSDMLPGYHLELIKRDTAGDAGLAMRYLIDMIQSPPQKIMLIGPTRSESCLATAETAKWWNLLQIAATCTWEELSDRSRFPLFHRIPMPEAVFTPMRVAFLEYFNWKRAAIIHRDDNAFNRASDLLAAGMSEKNITLVTIEIFTDENAPDQAVYNVKETDARIIFTFNRHVAGFFCQAYKNGLYGGRYVLITLYFQTTSYTGEYWWESPFNSGCTPEQIYTAAQGSIMFDQEGFRDDDTVTVSGLTAQEFSAEYNELLMSMGQYIPTSFSAYGYDAMWAIAMALNSSIGNLPDNKTLSNFTYDDSDMSAEFLRQFGNLHFEGVSGPVLFDGGDRVGRVGVYQLTGNVHQRRGSFFHETGQFVWESDFVWPGGETPKDRGMVERMTVELNKTVVYIAYMFAALGITLSLGFLTFNIVYRDKRYIKMSSPNLNNSIVAGAVLVYLAVFFLGGNGIFTSLSVTTLCQLRTWLLCFGFTLSFGSMFSKTWRVHKIFTNKRVKTVKIRDLHLFGIVLCMLGLDSVILGLWSVIDPEVSHFKEYPAVEANGLDLMIIPVVEACESQHEVVWLSLLLGYKGLILVFGVFLAWETRKVKYAQLNDSRYIGFAVYNVTVLCCVGAPTTMFLTPLQKDLKFIITSLCAIFCTTMTLCIVFVPKILEHRDSQRHVDDSGTHTMTMSQNAELTLNTVATTTFPHSSGSCRKAEEELLRFRQIHNNI